MKRFDCIHASRKNSNLSRLSSLTRHHGTTAPETAITKWLRPDDIARYEKIADPWVEVSKNLAH